MRSPKSYRADVQTNLRGYVEVDAQLRTSAPHVFAAGDITGRAMVVHEAVRQGLVAATNAVLGRNTHCLPGEPDRQLHGPGVRLGRADPKRPPGRPMMRWWRPCASTRSRGSASEFSLFFRAGERVTITLCWVMTW